MSDDKPLSDAHFIDHIEPLVQKLEPQPSDITTIRGDLSSTVQSRGHGIEISATALDGASDQAIPRINVYENIPFAGGDGDYSIMSVLFGAHSIGGGILGYLTMIDSNKVRLLCIECRQAVMDFPWMDNSRIKGSIKAWRAAFSCARAVYIYNRQDIVDADFVHIRGDARVRLHTVNMSFCRSLTDAAFVHLRGIHTLDMRYCRQVTITDAAFVHMRGIHTLYVCLLSGDYH